MEWKHMPFTVLWSHPVGSRYTCDPAPTDTDEDTLVLIDPAKFEYFLGELELNGWKVEGDTAHYESPFVSLRRGYQNIIATDDEGFAMRFLAATSVAKRLNLLNKEDRIALFQAVLYGNPCDDVGPPSPHREEVDLW